MISDADNSQDGLPHPLLLRGSPCVKSGTQGAHRGCTIYNMIGGRCWFGVGGRVARYTETKKKFGGNSHLSKGP